MLAEVWRPKETILMPVFGSMTGLMCFLSRKAKENELRRAEQMQVCYTDLIFIAGHAVPLKPPSVCFCSSWYISIFGVSSCGCSGQLSEFSSRCVILFTASPSGLPPRSAPALKARNLCVHLCLCACRLCIVCACSTVLKAEHDWQGRAVDVAIENSNFVTCHDASRHQAGR